MYPLKFFNSRTNSIDQFDHDPSKPINIYTCGPTVYDTPHLGNLKTFLWSDFVITYLNAIGYSTNHIINITDIDDKILARIPDQTLDALKTYTQTYTDQFINSLAKLGIKSYKSNIYKVSDHIEQINHMIKELYIKGFAYVVSDGSIYFDTEAWANTFPEKSNPFASNNLTFGYEPSRHIIKPQGIKSPRDFVLWKATHGDISNILTWEPPTGILGTKDGRVGWHIECSAIAEHVLGKVHIKMGGSDLKSVHHCCEIYQSEALEPSKPFGDYWIHFGFLNMCGEKMSKSLGNIIKLQELESIYNLSLVRLYLLSKSYKNDFDFNPDEIANGSYLKTNWINLHLLYNKLDKQFYRKFELNQDQTKSIDLTSVYNEILQTIGNNFNVWSGLVLLFEYVDRCARLELTQAQANIVKTILDMCNNLFNIIDSKLLEISMETFELVLKREEYRKTKQYALSDLMRAQLQLNYIFEDNSSGFSLIKKV
jgi:cysteinyl-tRNA synthetase